MPDATPDLSHLPLADPPLHAPEAEMLRAFLAYQRQVFRRKLAGLDQTQLATTVSPSPMTLGGIAKHLAFVESWWTRETIVRRGALPPFDTAPWDDDRDWEWHSAAADDPDELRALLDRAIAESDRIVDDALAGPDGLDTRSARASRDTGEPFTLRWILVHLIEEWARHVGHADYLREAIDGRTGD